MPLEIEMKLSVPSDKAAEKLFAEGQMNGSVRSVLEPTPYRSRYYDTADGDISARKWTLRLRDEGSRTVAALKTRVEGSGSALFYRNEWQVPAASIEEGIQLLIDDGAPRELLDVIGGKPLIELCGVEFIRHGIVVEMHDGLVVDITEDKGKLVAGDKSEPLHEIEVELLFGRPAELEPLVDHLIEEYGLKRELLSKYERALRLVRSRGTR